MYKTDVYRYFYNFHYLNVITVAVFKIIAGEFYRYGIKISSVDTTTASQDFR